MARTPLLSHEETKAFCSQMAMILKAGMSTYEGIALMKEDAASANDERSSVILEEIYTELNATGDLHRALCSTGVFPGYMLSMILIGEQTGRLDDVMGALADYYGKEANLAVTIRNAITYPCMMVLMMIAVILVLITKVLPIFGQVFAQLGSEMTGFPGALLAFGAFLNSHIAVLAGAIVVLVIAAFWLGKSKSGQAKLLAFAGRFRMTRLVGSLISRYRFANGMALTLGSGLTPENCLELTVPLVRDSEIAAAAASCREMVTAGRDLGEALAEAGIYTGMQARMLNIASRSGQMDDVMRQIAMQYEDDIDARISKLISSIEPALVIVLSIAVGIILLSVMMPMIGILAAL